jgi:hypothetical protein
MGRFLLLGAWVRVYFVALVEPLRQVLAEVAEGLGQRGFGFL